MGPPDLTTEKGWLNAWDCGTALEKLEVIDNRKSKIVRDDRVLDAEEREK